jgi:hypothetical protein
VWGYGREYRDHRGVYIYPYREVFSPVGDQEVGDQIAQAIDIPRQKLVADPPPERPLVADLGCGRAFAGGDRELVLVGVTGDC